MISMTKHKSPLKAIRAKCIDCMCGQKYEVRLCPSTDCDLHPFRFGRNPNRKGIGNTKNLIPITNDSLSKSKSYSIISGLV